jgi:photosystem II stability/assembly factor-like uncharacterized protein
VKLPALLLAGLCLGATAAAQAAPTASLFQRPPLVAAQPARAPLMAVARAGQRLVAVGVHGTIVLSDDNGASWRSASVPADVTLTTVQFANERVGWAAGHMGAVLRTEDRGEHWSVQLDGLAVARLALAQAVNDEQRRQAERLVQDGPDKPWLNLLVESDQQVTLSGAFNLALQTTDGGHTWRWISDRFANPSGFHLYGLARGGAGALAVGEQGTVLASADGVRFTPVTRPYEGSFFGVTALGDKRFLVFGIRGNAFVTSDAGATWTRSETGGTTASFNAAAPLSGGVVALADHAGRVYVSGDGGRKFTPLPYAGAPITGMTEAADGALVLSSLAGVARIPEKVIKGVMRGSNLQ